MQPSPATGESPRIVDRSPMAALCLLARQRALFYLINQRQLESGRGIKCRPAPGRVNARRGVRWAGRRVPSVFRWRPVNNRRERYQRNGRKLIAVKHSQELGNRCEHFHCFLLYEWTGRDALRLEFVQRFFPYAQIGLIRSPVSCGIQAEQYQKNYRIETGCLTIER